MDLDLSAVLLDDDIVRHRQSKPCSLAGRLRREEGIKHLFLHLGRNADAIVADADLHGAAEVLGLREQRWLETGFAVFRLAPGRRIEAVRDQVEQRAGDLLWKQLGRTGAGIEAALQRDIEA